MVPVSASEISKVACEYALVFSLAEGMPMAVLGFDPGKYHHIALDGRWRGGYIPAHLRRYPFLLVDLHQEDQTLQQQSQWGIQVDLAAENLSVDSGERLFDDQGKATPTLTRVQQTLVALHQDFLRTKKVIEQLEGFGLLTEQKMQLTLPGGEPKVLTGFKGVETKVLAELPPEKLALLRDSGALQLIYAHLISLNHVANLFRLPQGSHKKSLGPAAQQSDLQSLLGGDNDRLRFDFDS